MRTFIIIFIILLTYSTSYGQLAGCFQKSKGRLYKSILTFNKEGTYLHKIILKGDHPITSFERGNYTIIGDSIIFSVTEYGVEENQLQPQIRSLTRNGVLKNKTITLLAKEGQAHEKLRKRKCRQKR